MNQLSAFMSSPTYMSEEKNNLSKRIQRYERELKSCDLEAAMFKREERREYESLRNDFVGQTLAWLRWIDAPPQEVRKNLEEAYYEFKTSWHELKNKSEEQSEAPSALGAPQYRYGRSEEAALSRSIDL